MSTVEEDIELRDLVAQTLEKNGCLGKLRAELRASIFLALDEDVKLSKQQPLQNLRIQSYLGTPEGRAMFGLVREFLDFFNLQFTISVYEPESYFESIGQYEGRQKIAKDLGLDNTEHPTVPLLQQLLKIAQVKSNILDINLNVNSNINGSYIDESLNIDSSYKKTETYNNSTLSKTISKNDSTKLESDPKNESDPVPNETHYLNKTFDLNSPTVNVIQLSKLSTGTVPSSKNVLKDVIKEEDDFEQGISIKGQSETVESFNQTSESLSNVGHVLGENNGNLINNVNNLTVSPNHRKQLHIENEQNEELIKKVIKEDDTYEDTSSIAEDSEAAVNTNSSKTTEKSANEEPLLSPLHIAFKSNDNTLQQKTNTLEKPKLSPQRPKTSLSSLTDLPPLSMNKTRVNNDILPSLYNKEFKNKSSLKELDKMFDMDAEYEEDFLYSSNQLSLATQTKNVSDEPGVINKMDSEKLNILNRKDNKSSRNKVVSDVGKAEFRPSASKTCSNLLKTGEPSTNGSLSEHSLSD